MSVNKVILVGNLGKDPDSRFTPQGVPVTTFSLATTERYKDREGNRQETVTWHNLVLWRGLAEIASKYLSKGKMIYVEGKISNRSYDDRDGNKKYISEVVVDQMQMLGGRDDNSGSQQAGGAQQQQSYGGSQQQPQQAQPQGQQSMVQPSNAQTGGYGGQFSEPAFNPEDEVPFNRLPEFRELK